MRLGLRVPEQRDGLLDFAAVGEGGVDVISLVDSLPAFDRKTRASSRHVMAGGQAATAAAGVARLGWRSRWIGVTGDDDWGRMLRRALQQEGVDVSASVRPGVATRSAVVLVDRASGRRAIVESRDSALDMGADEIPPGVLCSGRIILVDGTDMQLSLRTAATARRAGLRTMVDLDRQHPATMQLLSEIDVVILPEGLVHDLTATGTSGKAVASLAAALPRTSIVAATLGEAGVVGWCRGEEIHVPAYTAEVRDTTGAGDAFRAGFAARWLETGNADPDVSDLLEYAALVAGLSCQALGAQTGLPTKADVARARSRRV
jgi:sugar/nucleoside kinase (ribokinase family)